MASYLKMLERGEFKDVFCYGVADAKRGFLLVNPLTDPGAIYCGGMGSGKSQAMKFTLLIHVIANSENTLYLLYDGIKGMTDYRSLFPLEKNVAKAVNDPAKIVPLIDMVYAEMMARKEEFSKHNASNIKEYDKIMKAKDPNAKELARIVMAVEEFHSIPNSEYVKFPYKVDTPGSVANQLKDLMRVGRSYGLTLLAATQRAIAEDIPSTLKVGLSQTMAFRTNNPNDSAALDLSHAQDIPTGMSGRCAYRGGFIQFPYLGDTDETSEWLLRKYYKPFRGKTLKYSIEDFQKAFSGEGNDGILLVKPYREIVLNSSQFDHVRIAERFLKAFNFQTEDQKNSALMCNLLAQRDGKKYAVLVINNHSTMSSPKAAASFKEAVEYFKADFPMAICVDKSVPGSIGTYVNSAKGMVLDTEDLLKISGVLDNRIKLEEEGKFTQLFEKLPLAQKPEEPVSKEDSSDDDIKDLDDGSDPFSVHNLSRYKKS